MADWKKLAEALNTGIPDAQIETIRPTLDGLQKLFQPLTLTLQPDDDIATPFVAQVDE